MLDSSSFNKYDKIHGTITVKRDDCELINKTPPIEFPYKLDIFQKNAINSIEEGNNVLVTAHTSAGKSTVAEYGIAKAIEQGKKVIYTSPIKTLSNQKYCDFCKRFDSVGILTGDIKQNPDANILVMTTEILRNMLFKSSEIIDELFCVIFDEVHYINDIDRGHIWEETIIMLPNKVQLIMLSATIENPRKLTDWIAFKERDIDLVGTLYRPVPLSHNIYFKGGIINIMGNDKNFKSELYTSYEQDFNKFYKNYVKPNGLINEMVDKLIEKELYPCIFFSYSRKKCEEFATMINKNLVDHEEISRIEFIINKYLNSIFKNYQKLQQTQYLIKLLMKGIGYHHSGLVHPLKEIQEILFSQGLIKILFATETFSVGVNMPTRCVIFTELTKYDGTRNDFRYLNTSEYLQMAGRAGRRGKDTEGTVIYLPLKQPPKCVEMKNILTGNATSVKSKLKLNTKLLLKIVQSKDFNVNKFLQKSLLDDENSELIDGNRIRLENLKREVNRIETDQMDSFRNNDSLNEIFKLEKEIKNAKQNQRKKINAKLKELYDDKNIKREYDCKIMYLNKKDELNELELQVTNNPLLLELSISSQFLKKLNYILESDKKISELSNEDLTKKGFMAAEINECNEITLTEIISRNILDDLSFEEIFGLLGIFIEEVQEQEIIISELYITDKMKSKINKIGDLNTDIEQHALDLRLNMNNYLSLNFIESAYMWAKGSEYIDIIKKTEIEMYEGNFVRNIFKIYNICNEIIKVSEIINKTELLAKFDNFDNKIIRDIVSFDSLYLLN